MHKNIIITVIAAFTLLAAAPASADGTHLSVKGNAAEEYSTASAGVTIQSRLSSVR